MESERQQQQQWEKSILSIEIDLKNHGNVKQFNWPLEILWKFLENIFSAKMHGRIRNGIVCTMEK